MEHDREAEAAKLALLRREVGRGLTEAENNAFSHRTPKEIFDAVGEEGQRSETAVNARRRSLGPKD